MANRDHRMVVRADARAMGAVTDSDVRVTPRWKGSKPGKFTSECVSYKLDSNGNMVEAHIFRPKREHISRTAATSRNERNVQRLHLLELAGMIGDVD